MEENKSTSAKVLGEDITLEQLSETTRAYLAANKLDKEGADILTQVFMIGVENRWNQSQFADFVDCSTGALTQILNGTYNASLKNMVARFKTALRKEIKRRREGGHGHIDTKIYLDIKAVAESAADDGMPGFVVGKSQSGKSHSLEKVCQFHPGWVSSVSVRIGT